MDGIDGYDLWLIKEPTAIEVINDLKKYKIDDFNEIVFCGFGEPMIRLDVLLEVAESIKKNNPKTIIRINTNGHANLYYNSDITPRLKGIIDKLSISLNAPNSLEYEAMCHSNFGDKAYEGLLEFTKLAKRYVADVRLTVVDLIGQEKINECLKVADDNNVELYIRKLV